jgi:hypothetical protein
LHTRLHARLTEHSWNARLQVSPSRSFGQATRLDCDIVGHPLWKWRFDNDVMAGVAVLLMDARQGSGSEMVLRAHHRRP